MIRRHMRIEREVVEQHTLFDLPWSHHRLSSCFSTGLNQRAFTVSTSEFFNRIDQRATLRGGAERSLTWYLRALPAAQLGNCSGERA